MLYRPAQGSEVLAAGERWGPLALVNARTVPQAAGALARLGTDLGSVHQGAAAQVRPCERLLCDSKRSLFNLVAAPRKLAREAQAQHVAALPPVSQTAHELLVGTVLHAGRARAQHAG